MRARVARCLGLRGPAPSLAQAVDRPDPRLDAMLKLVRRTQPGRFEMANVIALDRSGNRAACRYKPVLLADMRPDNAECGGRDVGVRGHWARSLPTPAERCHLHPSSVPAWGASMRTPRPYFLRRLRFGGAKTEAQNRMPCETAFDVIAPAWRFASAVACPRVEPSARLAPLNHMLSHGFFLSQGLVICVLLRSVFP